MDEERPDDPVLAVVAPPRLERFRELAEVGAGEPLSANFTGWSKLVLLTQKLAVLFPRDHRHVEPLRLEREALDAVADANLPEIPRVVAWWEDEGISAYPALAIERLPGTVLEPLLSKLDTWTLARIAEQIGRLAARWHAVRPGPLAGRPPRGLPHRKALDELLETGTGARDAASVVAEIDATIGLGEAHLQRVVSAVERARAIDHVLVHGDIHEAQILVDPSNDFAVTGIIDWQTALVDHPFTEFDLGEWGPTIWRLHRASFPMLRARYWKAYAAARGLPDDLGSIFEWMWAASTAMSIARGTASTPDVSGTLEDACKRVNDASRRLPD